jgi:mannosyltransferase
MGMSRPGVADRRSTRTARAHGVRAGWSPADWATAVVPGLAALAVGGYQLARPSLWRDEAYTVDAASRSVSQIVRLVHGTDAVNGTYYLIMHPVITLWGTTETVLRWPSVLAMAIAAVFTSAIGRRLAAAAALPSPAVTGMLAGLLLAAAPLATRYAQEARSYAMVTMAATVASYLLLRGLADRRWQWWTGYSVALTAMGLLNLLSVLLVAAHAVTVLLLWLRSRPRSGADRRGEPPPSLTDRSAPGPGTRTALGPGGGSGAGRLTGPVCAGHGQPGVPLRRWLVAVVCMAVALAPLAAVGVRQRQQVGWLTRPGLPALEQLILSFAGSRALVPLIALLACAGTVASTARRRHGPLTVATVAVPWLVVPPVILVSLSQALPLFDTRYVLYCLPALSLLAAAGLARITALTASTVLGRSAAPARWLPATVVLVLFAGLAIGPQVSVRQPWSRPDDLRKLSRMLAALARPGDGVLYLPTNMRVVSMAYPGPFRSLRDIALSRTPVAAGNLIGTDVGPALLRRRASGARRLWVISDGLGALRAPHSATQRAEVRLLASYRLAGRWDAGAVILSRYVRR